MIVVASDAHRAHHGSELHNGEFIASVECPERVDAIGAALRADGHEFVEPGPLDIDLLRRVHAPEYIVFLSTAWTRWIERGESGSAAMGFAWPTRSATSRRPDDLIGQLGYHSFGADCTIVDGTWEAALGAAAIAASAADRVADGDGTTFALCRPPGHHATSDQFGGYCYLNNAAAAAQRLLDRGMARVAILDVDYHHGNGTQDIFYERDDVLFVSIHADPIEEFPWFAGHGDEVGSGAGEGWNLNLPLPRETDVPTWMSALDNALTAIGARSVDALVVSLGVDTYVDDPLGTFQLRTDDFTEAARRIASLALPTVIVQEGGYLDDALGPNVAAFLRGCFPGVRPPRNNSLRDEQAVSVGSDPRETTPCAMNKLFPWGQTPEKQLLAR